jgi:hypothetical protein
MKKVILVLSVSFLLSGCAAIATVKKYWPRDHDPVMLNALVTVEQDLDAVDCKKPNWDKVLYETRRLDRYAELRGDPQRDNLQGLYKHIEKLSTSTNPVFCDLGKKTGKQRIDAALSAWRGR